ncbi:MAG: hypothetical protein ACE5OS_12655 [Anaerolineae bacterium]
MTDDDFPRPIQPREQEVRKLLLSAGTAYGLIFGFSFALFTWGYDALLLASSTAHLAWTKLLLGLPLAIVIGSLTGRLAASSPSTAVSVTLWAAAGGLFGVIAGHIPFDGGNLAAWLADRRLWGVPILAYGHAAAVRTTLVVFINVALGTAVGFVESLAVQWAWDRATPDSMMSGGSWAVLLVCVPLALLLAVSIDGFINQPLRTPQWAVSELVRLTVTASPEVTEAQEASYRSIEPFREALSEHYVSHFVGFGSDTESWYSAYVDVIFDNGFVLRCATVGKNVVYCGDFSQKFAAWMGDLVHAGLYDERPWLDAKMRRLAVNDVVVAWLAAHSDQLSETYEVSRDGQQGGWVFMSARFDTGFEMVCRFRGATPVLVDQCLETSTSSR